VGGESEGFTLCHWGVRTQREPGGIQCLYSDGENNPFRARREKSTIDERRRSILCTKTTRDGSVRGFFFSRSLT